MNQDVAAEKQQVLQDQQRITMMLKVSDLPTCPEQASTRLDPTGTSRQRDRVEALQQHDEVKQATPKRLIERHNTNKRLAERLAVAGCQTYAYALESCSVTEGLWYCTNCMQPSYHINHCKLRLCAHCAPTYSFRRAQLVTLMAQHMHRPSLLTLTQRRTYTLRDGIKRLREAWTKFRHTGIGKKMWGGFYQIECKPKPDGWHVHLHAIIDAPYIPKPSLYKCWAKCLGQETASVDIQRLKNFRDAAKYATKYACKPHDVEEWNPEQLAEFLISLRRRRLEGTWGTMYNVTADDYLEKIDEPHRKCPHCSCISSTFPIHSGIGNYGTDWKDIFERLFARLPQNRTRSGLEQLLETEVHRQQHADVTEESDWA